VGITAGSREVPGRNGCDRRHPYRIIIISALPILAKEQYIKRHDRVCAQLHFNKCKETAVQLDRKQRYEHVTKSVETSEGGKVTILWN